jgi:putative transposase
MLKTFKYRLYPTKKQARQMQATLEECRWLWNYLLEQRKTAWKERKESLTYYQQTAILPRLKQQRPSLKHVHSQVLQNVAARIDLAFQAFFRRIKAGEKPGYPRFCGRGRYDSFTYPQSGFQLAGDRLHLSKIGDVRVILHRPIEGKIKTCTIRRTATGDWFATFSCEVEAKPLPPSSEGVGIDVGLESFAVLSDGTVIDNPRFFRRDEKDLARAQRKLSQAEKGTREYVRRRKAVAKIHKRIANRRNDFAHQLSRHIVNRFGFIAIEDLSVNRMVHNRCLSKSVMDAAWSQFFQYLSYKAECAGRTLVRVNPAYTSQDCSRCGHRQAKKLNDRIHDCSCCGLKIDRDLNAALNILALGRQGIGLNP